MHRHHCNVCCALMAALVALMSPPDFILARALRRGFVTRGRA